MNIADVFSSGGLVWPLSFIVVALVLMHRLRNDLSPIFRAIVNGLALHAQRNAMLWFYVFIYASLASGQVLIDEAEKLGLRYLASIARVVVPAIGATAALFRQLPAQSNTNPPFPPEAKP